MGGGPGRLGRDSRSRESMEVMASRADGHLHERLHRAASHIRTKRCWGRGFGGEGGKAQSFGSAKRRKSKPLSLAVQVCALD